MVDDSAIEARLTELRGDDDAHPYAGRMEAASSSRCTHEANSTPTERSRFPATRVRSLAPSTSAPTRRDAPGSTRRRSAEGRCGDHPAPDSLP